MQARYLSALTACVVLFCTVLHQVREYMGMAWAHDIVFIGENMNIFDMSIFTDPGKRYT